MEELKTEDIRKMGLNNFQYEWLDRNIGSLWGTLIADQPNEKQWDLWNQLISSKLGKAWDEKIARDKEAS